MCANCMVVFFGFLALWLLLSLDMFLWLFIFVRGYARRRIWYKFNWICLTLFLFWKGPFGDIYRNLNFLLLGNRWQIFLFTFYDDIFYLLRIGNRLENKLVLNITYFSPIFSFQINFVCLFEQFKIHFSSSIFWLKYNHILDR